MAGHSHWARIKYKKEAADQKKGQIFSKLAREIEVAARLGKDPELNPKLRMAIEKAREMKMPSENIERAIKRGCGELESEKLEEILFEAYGPGKVAILIEGITDNKNRAINEVRQVLEKFNGKLVGEGGVRWMFEKKGCITLDFNSQNLKSKEDLEIIAIEAGAEDLYWHGDLLDVYTKIEDLEKVKRNLMEKGLKIESASLDWVPKEMVEVKEKEKEELEKLFENLDELDSVQEIYSNLKT